MSWSIELMSHSPMSLNGSPSAGGSHVLIEVRIILALVPGSHPAWAGIDLNFLEMIAHAWHK